MNKTTKKIKGIEIKKDNKIIRINKLVYMNDLKIFIIENENAVEIDNKIFGLYKNRWMKINESKSGITPHKNIEILEELNKYQIINKNKNINIWD